MSTQKFFGYLPWGLILITALFCVWAVSTPTPVTRPLPDESSKTTTTKTTPAANTATPAKSEESDVLVEAPGPTPEGMVWIPGGTFTMGNKNGDREDEQFEHPVTLDGYWIDKTEVTKAQFEKFVQATGYKTVAEAPPDPTKLVGAEGEKIDPAMLVPGSVCFTYVPDGKPVNKDHPLWPYQLWSYVKGADWRHPEGPDSSIKDRMNHPVTHVCYDDVMAYAKWAGKQLPTEAEWEFAARGKLVGANFTWGDQLVEHGQRQTNIWQGEFPYQNKVADGFVGTAPVGSFPANGYGLFDMSGNVWEWCADWYQPEYYRVSPRRNPVGPDSSFDPNEPKIPKRITRGGSFLCNENYCTGYRVTARMKGAPDTGLVHTGFRCVIAPRRGGQLPTRKG